MSLYSIFGYLWATSAQTLRKRPSPFFMILAKSLVMNGLRWIDQYATNYIPLWTQVTRLRPHLVAYWKAYSAILSVLALVQTLSDSTTPGTA